MLPRAMGTHVPNLNVLLLFTSELGTQEVMLLTSLHHKCVSEFVNNVPNHTVQLKT